LQDVEGEEEDDEEEEESDEEETGEGAGEGTEVSCFTIISFQPDMAET
jgi:hypothetical protein